MDLTIIAVILSAVTSLISIVTAGGTAIYAFAVLRTEVNALKLLGSAFDLHAKDDNKHFNVSMFDQFKLRMEEKFDAVKDQITGVKEQVESVRVYCQEIDTKIDEMKT